MSLLSRYICTEFKPDNISIDPITELLLDTPIKFVAPRVRDNRDLCLPTNNQRAKPYCTAFATTGYCEVLFWMNNNYPIQMDPDPVYIKAKSIDGIPNANGSYIECTLQAAMDLGLINQLPIKRVQANSNAVKFAIHKYNTVIAAFRITSDWNNVDKSGSIKSSSSPKILGGHAVLICGYDEYGVHIQNSWGYESWGNYGFAHLSWKQFNEQFLYGVVA